MTLTNNDRHQLYTFWAGIYGCVGLSRHMWRSVGLDKININNFLTFLEISKMSTVVVKKENPTEASSAQLQPSTAAESLPITNILIARCYKIKF